MTDKKRLSFLDNFEGEEMPFHLHQILRARERNVTALVDASAKAVAIISDAHASGDTTDLPRARKLLLDASAAMEEK